MGISLSEHEARIALIALEHTRWAAGRQMKPSTLDSATGAAWYCLRHCIAEIDALIVRLDEAQKNEAEEK